MPWIEQDDFVPRRIVVFLITGEEYIGSQIREHLSYSVDKNIGFVQPVVYPEILINAVVYIADEVIRIGLVGQFGSYHVRLRLVIL